MRTRRLPARAAGALLLGTMVAAGCGEGSGFPDARPIDAPVPNGTISATWSLTDAQGAAIACDRVGGIAVTAELRNRSVDGGSTQVFTCGTGAGTSQAVVPGTYDIGFVLTGTTGMLATAPVQRDVVVEPGKDTALMPLTFAVDARGALKLHVTARPGGNCAAPPTGAGITGNTFALRLGGACATQTFAIGAGATQPAGSYAVDCASPVVAPCVEADQELSIASLPSGNYTLQSTGLVGGASCWTSTVALTVPPLGGTLTQAVPLVYAAGTPGCP